MRIGYVQTYPQLMKVESNVAQAIDMLRSFDADLVVLPELFNTGYSLSADELREVAEEVPTGYSIDRLMDLSKDRGIGVVAGFAERAGDRFYNSSALITPSSVRVHRKVHLFDREKLLFEPGNGFEIYKFKGARIGMMVCFDWFFPESCRTLMLKGADVIAHPANLVLPFWPKAAATRAIENHVFIVTAGRVGRERGLRFIGSSLIVSPSGKFLASSGRKRVETAAVDVDPAEAREKRITSHNDIMGDRRPQAYELG